MDALDAYDLLRYSALLHERIAATCTVVSTKRVISQEKTWLATARDLLSGDQEPARLLIDRARMLPELLEAREEFAAGLQQFWVDSLEKLIGGITFHAGSRSPLIETILPHQKFPALRKASREQVTQFQGDIEKRLKLSYVQRMLTDATFSFVPSCLDQIQTAYAEWLTSYSSDSMSDDQAAPIREELVALGERAELLCRQARLLAEAALLPIEGAFEEHGLNLKPRKRSRGKKAELSVDSPDERTLALEAAVEAAEAAAVVEDALVPSEAIAGDVPPAAPKKSRKKKAVNSEVPVPEDSTTQSS